MNTVTKIRPNEIDVREHQAQLLTTEAAALECSLEQCSLAAGAFVQYLRKLEVSVTHPKVRQLLKRIPEIISKAAEIPGELAECHILAEKLSKTRPDLNVVMSGGIPKDDHPIDPY